MEAPAILTTLALVDFEAYLISKKIDTIAFAKSEFDLWQSWKAEFEQIHPNSFTAQKLFLINPLRRKYPLKIVPTATPVIQNPPPMISTSDVPAVNPPGNQKPAIPRPIIRPKPKLS